MDKKDILNAFEFRHACKEFDESKKISDEDIRFILETGRLSPSSFGLEQWKFLVVQKPEIKTKLRAASYDQLQLSTASHIVVILAKKGLYEPGNDHVAEMFKRWNYPEEIYNYLIEFHSKLAGNLDLAQWAVEQCHLAAANMMTTAAMIGIDSCPIGGFEPDKANEALKIDTDKYKIAMIIPFGYRANQQPAKTRLPFDEVVEFYS